jgi:tRNA nucleotidyltransferase/poly(A) polymerase
LIGGLEDIAEPHGAVHRRRLMRAMAEDYLRVLRYFRFYAQLRGRPSRRRGVEGLHTGARQAFEALSAERIWKELKTAFQAAA